MRREEKRKLSVNRRIIVNHLKDLESVLDYLITKQIFTSSLRQKINKESQGKQDRIRHMLDILESKSIVLAYQYFLEALVVTDNLHVANILEPDYCASEQCRLVIERERMRGFHCSSSGRGGSESMNNELVNLPFPITCTQNHLESPVSSSPSSSSSLSNQVNSNALAPMSIQRIMRQNQTQNYLLNTNNSNYFFSNINSSSSQSTSRSTSSSGGYQSNSMSPTINRSRSSSVTAFLNSGRNNISTSASVNGLINLTNASKNLNSECSTLSNMNHQHFSPNNNTNARAAVSGMAYDDSDQISPTNSGPPTNMLPHTPTYNIDWSDVNKLELDFSVTKSFPNIRKQLSPNECYQMEQNPRGICLIINNEHFYDQNNIENIEMRRHGTDMDASRLKNLFEKLNFQVEMFVDLREIEMRRVINEFANECEQNANRFDAICLIVLSHGTDGYIYGVDFENKLNMDKDVLNIFDDVLVGKPKLFIFQACRGEHLNQKDMSNSNNTHTSYSTSHIFSNPSSSTASPTSSTKLNTQLFTTTTSAGVSIDEETINSKFKQLKMSSNERGASIQLKFKKKSSFFSSSTTSPLLATSSSSPGVSKSPNSNPILTTGSRETSSKRLKTRSRSHSRSKYSQLFTSAATAMKNVIKPSNHAIVIENSSKASISTQTSFTQSSSSPSSKPTDLPEYFFKNLQQKSPSESTQPASTAATSSGYLYESSNIIASSTSYKNPSLSNFIDGRPIKTFLPSRSDFFIWYSSVRGFASHRDVDGSPFIKCLVTVFSKCAYELELCEMVAKVNMLMQQYERIHFDEKNAVASYFMAPVMEFHLAKKFYFNP